MADTYLQKFEETFQELFHAAISVSGPERDEYLTVACGGDDGLRKELESLTNAYDRNPLLFNDRYESVRYASEAIVVIDMVQATATNDRFGWYAVGRSLVRELREIISTLCKEVGLSCMKSTGDGFLLTFRNTAAAELAAVDAVDMMLKLVDRLAIRNGVLPEERHIDVRAAIHFGEVDVLEKDREGPSVSYAFRIEAVDRGHLPHALNPIEPLEFPLRNYIICSERVNNILFKRDYPCNFTSCGLFKLRGFAGWWELFLIGSTNSSQQRH